MRRFKGGALRMSSAVRRFCHSLLEWARGAGVPEDFRIDTSSPHSASFCVLRCLSFHAPHCRASIRSRGMQEMTFVVTPDTDNYGLFKSSQTSFPRPESRLRIAYAPPDSSGTPALRAHSSSTGYFFCDQNAKIYEHFHFCFL